MKSSSKNVFFEDIGISPENWSALKKEMEEGGGTPIVFDVDLSVLPSTDDNSEDIIVL